jgi:hypothetical protein
MSSGLERILVASAIGLAAVLVHWTFSQRRLAKSLASIVVIAVAIWIVTDLAPGVTTQRDATSAEIASVVICYLSMVLGMLAEYLYGQAEQREQKLKFELMPLLMPILASPIVFIPLLTITTDVAAGGAFTRAKLMVYLVAFQNEFFWKKFFEQQRHRELTGAH